MEKSSASIAVVIPCYRVRQHISQVISAIGPDVQRIYCVDDHCPDESGKFIQTSVKDARVTVITHDARQAGGAMITGYRRALKDGADIVVKLDGDGQMDPKLIPVLVAPLLTGKADYTKGNRFYRIEDLKQMPTLRVFGNAILSFFSKISTGYWEIFDPTNGFTAIYAKVLALVPLEKISKGFFYESDMLFRLNTLRAVVMDVPMTSLYANEASNLSIPRVIPVFVTRHIINFIKRVFYIHFLRSFDLASFYLLAGIPMFIFGFSYGLYRWLESETRNIPATAGTVMLAGLPLLLGIQFFISFFHHDVLDTPRLPLQNRM